MTRRGVALAGGGPLGAIYEIGALVALDEALRGWTLSESDVFVGVSAGSFFAAGLANGLTPRQMYQSFIENTSDDPFEPELLMRPAVGEFARRTLSILPLLVSAAGAWFGEPTGRGFWYALEHFAKALPTGLFDNQYLISYLDRLFKAAGRSNDFRDLQRQLLVVATDLDSGEAAPFGAPGWDDVPISVAIAASSALPGLYPPVPYRGRYYVDGALKKTLHASVALKAGVRLLLCVNPLVPFDAALAEARTGQRPPPLIDSGLPLVLSQTFRSIIHSRMVVAMGRYATEYPDADIILFEPAQDDPDMFFVNVFSYADRRRLCEHAYQHTRRELLRRHDELSPVLARHGVWIDRAVLLESGRNLLDTPESAGLGGALLRLDLTLERLAKWLAAPSLEDDDVEKVHEEAAV